MSTLKQLLSILSDGRCHSGEIIAHQLAMTRAGIWKTVRLAKSIGFDIESVARQGYQLKDNISFLTVKKIKNHLSTKQKNNLKTIEVFDEIESTNTYLLQKIYEFSKIPRLCLAESQTQGRGRRGRIWHSPYAQNIYLSLLWKFSASRSDFHGLSLVVAMAIAAVLENLGFSYPVKLKWPNDIFINEKKCGGILIETRGEMYDGAQVVIGIGLNVNMKKNTCHDISQEWISLCQLQNFSIDRNQLAAHLIDMIIEFLEKFDAVGFEPFQPMWERYDLTIGKIIQVVCHDKMIKGEACGIDKQGRLKLVTAEGRSIVINVGDVSL